MYYGILIDLKKDNKIIGNLFNEAGEYMLDSIVIVKKLLSNYDKNLRGVSLPNKMLAARFFDLDTDGGLSLFFNRPIYRKNSYEEVKNLSKELGLYFDGESNRHKDNGIIGTYWEDMDRNFDCADQIVVIDLDKETLCFKYSFNLASFAKHIQSGGKLEDLPHTPYNYFKLSFSEFDDAVDFLLKNASGFIDKDLILSPKMPPDFKI